METIDVKHWYAIEAIVTDLIKDQRSALKEDDYSPIRISEKIQSIELAKSNLISLLEDWKQKFGYPNISNLKYINRF